MDIADLAQVSEVTYTNALLSSIKSPANRVQKISGKKVLCLRCDKPIPKRRLEAIPGVSLCVTCADKVARGHTLDDYDEDEEA